MSVAHECLPDRFLAREARADRPAAFVVGTNITGLTIARSLKRLGVLVAGVDVGRRFPTSHSRAWDALVLRADFDDHRLVDLLSREARRCTTPPALFLATDEQVKIVAEHGQGLAGVLRFEQSRPEATTLLMNKDRFTALAVEQGWPVPRSWAVRSRASLEELGPLLGFPVILKPQEKNLGFRKADVPKATRCESIAEVLAAYDRFAHVEPEVLLQEWIGGSDADIRYSFHYLTAEHEELARFEGRKIRQWLPECGSTSSATACDTEEVAALSLEILTRAGAVGLCSVEYKHDRTRGGYVIMEPTIGRPNLQLGAAVANGVDLIGAAYAHLSGRPISRTARPRRRATWMIVPSDIRSARFYIDRGDLTWSGWLASLSWPVIPSVWRIGDHGIWWAHLIRLVRAVPRRILRLMHRPHRPTAGPRPD